MHLCGYRAEEISVWVYFRGHGQRDPFIYLTWKLHRYKTTLQSSFC